MGQVKQMLMRFSVLDLENNSEYVGIGGGNDFGLTPMSIRLIVWENDTADGGAPAPLAYALVFYAPCPQTLILINVGP